ncbi:uncharacterized protein A1O5_04698 [Cladophialophora psammophila CBS 110553]|uniref:Uncharacterized protein n=1 Tax=Cladophialophora psammophila CBS 110553 TaxID=1182543 RepID=W9XPC3_9EURO|nr:uncharacterized protein A1O5_04698 [Cladophialophora psammophila CBS 110553]EXJ72194.1 hypothetical protein A1O5_04698 [Cladophialophora psammophila CBS 110553]
MSEFRTSVTIAGGDLLNLCGVVQFIHQALRGFVASPPFAKTILGDANKLQLDNGHTLLLKFCCMFACQNERADQRFDVERFGDERSDDEVVGLDVKLWAKPDLLELAYLDKSSTGRPATIFFNSLPESFFDTSELEVVSEHDVPDHYNSRFVFQDPVSGIKMLFQRAMLLLSRGGR